jgi:hypothetical protein
MVKHITEYLRRIFRFKRGPTYRPRCVADEPDRLAAGVLYIVGEKGCEWVAAFKCPCGCGEAIWLNLLEGHPQRWRIHHNRRGQLSLSPSINRIVGCRSHFFLWDGRIYWCLPRARRRKNPNARSCS